jgi:hypothetical protein
MRRKLPAGRPRRRSCTALVQRFRDHGELQQDVEGDDLERGLVGGFKHDGAGCSCLVNLKPSAGADAPAIALLEPWEAVLRHGCGEIVAQPRRGCEELLCDDAADGVNAEIVGAGVAASIAKKTGDGVCAASFQRLAEHILLSRGL